MKKSVQCIIISMILTISLTIVNAAAVISQSVVPLPPFLQDLPLIKMNEWMQVDEKESFLEGPALIDREICMSVLFLTAEY